MIRKRSFLQIALFLLLLTSIFTLPAQAEVTYRDVSRSISESFSGNRVNVIGIVLTVLFFALVILIFHLSWLRKEKEINRKRRTRVALRPKGQPHKRSWFRLKISAEFKWVLVGEASKTKEEQYNTGRLVDISGGGVSFITGQKLNPGDEIEFLLDTGRDKPMFINGRVLRMDEETGHNDAVYKVSVQFGNLTNGERDRIVSFIMRRQRDRSAKNKEDLSL